MRHWIVDVRYTSVFRMKARTRGIGEVEADVEVRCQRSVSNSWFAEGGNGGMVAEREELEACDCGDGAA